MVSITIADEIARFSKKSRSGHRRIVSPLAWLKMVR